MNKPLLQINNKRSIILYAAVTAVSCGMVAIAATYLHKDPKAELNNMDGLNVSYAFYAGMFKALGGAAVVAGAYTATLVGSAALKLPTNVIGRTIGFDGYFANNGPVTICRDSFDTRLVNYPSRAVGALTKIAVSVPLAVGCAFAGIKKTGNPNLTYEQRIIEAFKSRPVQGIKNFCGEGARYVTKTAVGVPVAVVGMVLGTQAAMKHLASENPFTMTRKVMNSLPARLGIATVAVATFAYANYTSYNQAVDSVRLQELPVNNKPKPVKITSTMNVGELAKMAYTRT